MDPWTERLLKMLVVPVCVAVAGLLAGLSLHALAVGIGTPVALPWAGSLFQASLVVALAMSLLGYRRLHQRQGLARISDGRPVLVMGYH